MLRFRFLTVGLLIFGMTTAVAQEVSYTLSWGAPNSHYFDVEMRFTSPATGPVDVRMPAWRPGRYVIQNFARNVIQFSVHDASGEALPFRKTDKQTWSIDGEAGETVVVRYKVWAHQMDAGNSFLDETEAHINPITLLMYLPGYESLPTRLRLTEPDGWKTATALDRATDGTYPAKDYHELVDSPFIVSPTLRVLSFEHAGAVFEIALQGDGSFDEARLIADFRAIVEAQCDLMGVVPFDRYVFLIHLLPYPHGHGVEHKNSTAIVLGPTDFSSAQFYGQLMGVVAHELFHVWNVERIRPEVIYRPDYSREAYTTTMWWYEGVTSYYTAITLLRAGLIDEPRYLARAASTMGLFEEDHGRKITSVAMSSWDSWIKQSGAPPHSFFSFYTAGSVLGLLLDLEVRGLTGNRESLDSVMRYLYRTYPGRDRGVPEDGLQQALEHVTGSSFDTFFRDFVHGFEEIPYDRFLGHAGYRLEVGVDAERSPVRLAVSFEEGGSRVYVESVEPGSGAFKAGLDIGDEIVAIDGVGATAEGLPDLLAAYRVGDAVRVTLLRRGRLRDIDVRLDGGANRTYRIVRLPQTSALQDAIRRSWLGLEED